MDQVRGAGLRCRAGDALCRRDVDGVEGLPAALVEDAGEIDDRVSAGDSAAHGVVVADIGLHRCDRAHIAAGAEESGKLRPSRRDADAPALPRETLDDVAPEKPGAAEDRDDSQDGPACPSLPVTSPVY